MIFNQDMNSGPLIFLAIKLNVSIRTKRTIPTTTTHTTPTKGQKYLGTDRVRTRDLHIKRFCALALNPSEKKF